MTLRLTYSGSVEPAVWLSFKSVTVPGAHSEADADFLYAIENESLFESRIVVTCARFTHTLTRAATRRNRRFDDALATYINDPVPAGVLNNIFDAQDRGDLRLFVTIRFWYKPFFAELLRFMTRTAADTANLARPGSADEATVLASFRHQHTGMRARVTHPDQEREIRDIPAMLSGWDIQAGARPGATPRVKLYVYLKVKESLPADRREETARLLMAMDYSKIYRYGRTHRARPWWGTDPVATRATSSATSVPTRGIERSLYTWERNVMNYLLNHTDLGRGERIRQAIVTRATGQMARPQLEVVQVVRDEIDARMVTANHWGDLREDWNTEQYQRKLSDLFGAIHQTQWWASPVSLMREISDALGLNADVRSALILQWGVGHCGEHAMVSFSIVRTLMQKGHAAKFENIVYSGNANIDHAFVVGGIRPREQLRTRRRHSFPPYRAGQDTVVWDLRDALAANPGETGFVLDPYLAPSRQSRTAQELLVSLNAARRGARRTDCLYYRAQHPPPEAPSRNVPSVRGV